MHLTTRADGIVTDVSRGLMIGVRFTEANASERLGVVVLLSEAAEKLSRLVVVWGDQGYSGPNFEQVVKQVWGETLQVDVIEHESKRFEVLPKRWS